MLLLLTQAKHTPAIMPEGTRAPCCWPRTGACNAMTMGVTLEVLSVTCEAQIALLSHDTHAQLRLLNHTV